jgi:hypothetical protein
MAHERKYSTQKDGTSYIVRPERWYNRDGTMKGKPPTTELITETARELQEVREERAHQRKLEYLRARTRANISLCVLLGIAFALFATLAAFTIAVTGF